MKKRLICLFVALCTVLMCFAFGGCHGAKKIEGFVLPETFDTSKNYEITFWAKNDSNSTQVEVYEKAVADFEALYPNIKVKLVRYSDYQKIYNDVITNIATGTTPNVCITYPDHIATYMTGTDIVVPLDGLIEDAKYGLGGSEVLFDGPAENEIVVQFLEECKIGESTYALPFMRSTEACYINKDMVEKLGYEIPDVLTWDFIWEVSEAAMAKNDDGTYAVNGQNVLIPFIYKSTDNMMIQAVKQLGGGYSDSTGKITLFNDVTKGIMKDITAHAATGAFNTFKIIGYPGNYFNAGQCIFAIDSTAGSTWMGSSAPLMEISKEDVTEFETVVRAVPQYDVENPQMISQGPSLCLFNKADSNEVLASWLFLQYLLTNEVQINYSQTEGYLPVTTKAQDSAEYREYLSLGGSDNELHYGVKIDAVKLLMNNTGNTFVTPVFNGSANLREAAGYLVEYATKLGQRNLTADDAALEQSFESAISLKHLNIDGDGMAEEEDLGTLPKSMIILIVVLVVFWGAFAAIFVSKKIKKAKSGHKAD